MITREQLPEGSIRLTFSLSAEESRDDVSVVGSFNDWSPGLHPLLGEDGGIRMASVIVEPGTYHFRYLATGGVWFDDEHADTISEYGGVLHCHRTAAPIETQDTDAAQVVAEVDTEPEPAAGQASTKSATKGRRQKGSRDTKPLPRTPA